MQAKLIAGVLALTVSIPVAARELHWDRMQVDLKLTPRGDLEVVEHLGYVFNGAWNGGYRRLPLAWVEGYSGIAVAQDGYGPYRRGDIRRVGRFQVRSFGNAVVVKWRSRSPSDPPYRDAHVGFTFSYTARGVVRYGKRFDMLRWNCVFPDRPSSIGVAEASLRLPPGIDPGRVRANLATFSTSSRVTVGPDGVIHAVARNLRPGDAMQLTVSFPTGIVARRFHRRQWGNRVGVWWLALAILLAGLTIHTVRFVRHGHDPDAPFSIKYLTRPPEGVDPALAGGLDAVVGLPEIMGTILDLARRGILIIEEVPEKVFGIFDRPKVTISRVAEGGPLEPWERTILDGLTLHGPGSSVEVAELKNKFYTTIPKFHKQVSEALVKAGWYARSPDAARGRQIAVSLLWGAAFALASVPAVPTGPGLAFAASGLIALALTLLVGRGKLFRPGNRPWSVPLLAAEVFLVLWGVGLNPGALLGLRSAIAPLVAAGVVTFVGFLFAPFMPCRTPEGAAVYEKVRAFGRYLKHLQALGDLQEARDRLDELLPYATAMGLDRSLLSQLEPLGEVPAPSWYVSRGTGGAGGSWGAGGAGSGGIVSLQALSTCLFYTSPSPRDRQEARMPSSA